MNGRFLDWHESSSRKLTPASSGGLSKDFAGSGQNRVTAKKQVRAGSSHSSARNITVVKFNKYLFCNLHWADTELL